MAWVARKKGVGPDEQKEVVLDSILERKTLDDLVGSIKDGRFKEQKVGPAFFTKNRHFHFCYYLYLVIYTCSTG